MRTSELGATLLRRKAQEPTAPTSGVVRNRNSGGCYIWVARGRARSSRHARGLVEGLVMQHVSRGIISRLVQVHTNLETSSSPVSTALPLSLVASLGDVLDGALPALEKTVRMEVLCCRSPRISEARRCSASGTNASSSTHNPHTCQVSRIPLLLLHVDELHRCGQHNRRRRSTVSESMADFGRRMESTHREAGEEEQHAKLLGGGRSGSHRN